MLAKVQATEGSAELDRKAMVSVKYNVSIQLISEMI